MYNSEFKTRFIEESNYQDITKTSIQREFSLIEYYEDMLGKDLSNFSQPEILAYYKLHDCSSVKSLLVINSYFITYTKFAIRNNYVNDGMNHYLELDDAILMTCINVSRVQKRIITQEQLFEIINDQAGVDLIASEKYILYGLFEGICGENYSDLINVTEDSFNGNVLTLKSGKVIEVPDKLKYIALDSIGEYEYDVPCKGAFRTVYFDRSDRTAIKPRLRKDSDLNNIPLMKKRSIVKTINKFATLLEIPISTTSIINSGRIYYIKTHKKPDEDARQFILDHRDYIFNKYGEMRNVRVFCSEFGDYL